MKHSFKKSALYLIIALALTFSAVGVTPARAAGIRYAKPSATGTGNCSNWVNACTLQTALTGAASGDEIWVKAGTHKPTIGMSRTATFQLKNGVAVYGGFDGTKNGLSQRNPAVNLTILSGEIGYAGNSDNSYQVVTGITGATLDGFTVTAGNANDMLFPSNGGGMYNYNSSPTLTDVTFSGNSANGGGGGMYNHNSSPTLTNVTFSGNSANGGGGMLNANSNPSLTNVTFSGNSATDFGGGMDNVLSSSPALTNVTFSNNSANYGGGMYNTLGSNPTLSNVTFSGNSAYGGGGMSNEDSSPTLTNVVFSGNSANYGGGIRNTDNSSPILTNVTFSDNSATTSSGGMYNSNSSPTLTNVTFSGNSATDCGGGMYNYFGSSPTLTNVTFSGNSADCGGGMYNGSNSNPQIRNTIFWGNTATTAGAQIYNDSSTPSVSYSVVQDGYVGGANIITTDPKLGALGDNGGFTQTIPLLAGSSAIDAGTNTGCPADDQRGIARPQDGNGDSTAICDIGAYEYDTTAPTVTMTSTAPNPTHTSPIAVTVQFSETVTGFIASDIIPGNGTVNNFVAVDGDTYTFNLTPSAQGRVTADIATGVAFDLAGNGNTAAPQFSRVYGTLTSTFRSVGTNDGWILESAETSNKGGTLDKTATTFLLGDGTADKQYRAILHFNTASLPDTAVITKVTLKIKKQVLVGTNPFLIFSGLKVDMRKPYFGANAGLVIGDFQAAAGKSNVAAFSGMPVSNWYSAVLNAASRAYVNLTGTTQFRLRFETDDNDDNDPDYMKFFSGNYATTSARPTLVIEYYVP